MARVSSANRHSKLRGRLLSLSIPLGHSFSTILPDENVDDAGDQLVSEFLLDHADSRLEERVVLMSCTMSFRSAA